MQKILYFIHLPPPLHGVAKANELIFKSDFINKNYNKRLIRINYNDDLSKINKFNFIKLIKYIKLFLKLLKELIVFQPNCIYYSIPPTGYGLYKDLPFVLMIKLFKIQPIYHLHGKGIYENTVNSKLSKGIHRFVYSNSNVIHLSKGLLQQEISLLNPIAAQKFTANNGIEDVQIKIPKRDEKINVLFLSNLFISKGILFSIKIISELIKVHNGIRFHVVGQFPDDQTKELIKKKVADLSMNDYITFYGALYDKQKFLTMSKMDFLLYPSFNDAFPLVILEALQVGLPVVASDQGAIPEILNEDIGRIFPTGDLERAVHCCHSLIQEIKLNNYQINTRCRKYYERHYTVEIFEKRMKEIFNQILG